MQTDLSPSVTFVVPLFPTVGQPVWDARCQEWVLVDSDGVSYVGSSPADCRRQFLEALHCLAEHARKSLCGVEDVLDYRTERRSTSADQLSLDHLTHR